MTAAAPGPTWASSTTLAASGARRAAGASGAAFALTLLLVAAEYLRPQDWFAPLARAPLPTLAALALLPCLARRETREALADPIVATLGLVVVFAAAWTPFASNRFWAFETFKFLALELLAVLAIVSFVDRPRRVRALLALLLAGFAVEAVWALLHGGRGLTVHFGDENDLAVGMNVALPFAVFGCFAARRPAARAGLAAMAALLVAAIVASASRGGLVALAATCASMVVFARRRVWLGLLLALGAATVFSLAPSEYWSDMATIGNVQDATRLERLRMWGDAMQVWWDHPMLGVGPGNIPWVIGRYEIYDSALTRSLAGRAVHSVYLTLLSELGLVGLALYGTLALLLLGRCRAVLRAQPLAARELEPWARAIPCSAAGYLAGGMFVSVLYYPHFYFLLALAAVLGRRPIGDPVVAGPARPRAPWATPLRLGGLAAATLLALAPTAQGASKLCMHLGFEKGMAGEPTHGPDAFDELARGGAFTRARSFDGRQSALMNIEQGSEGWDTFGGRRFFPRDQWLHKGDELWVRLRVLFPAGFDFSANPWLKLFRIHTGRGDVHEGFDDWYLQDPDRGNAHNIYISEVSGRPAHLCGTPADYPERERWETFEMYLRFDDRAVSGGGTALVRMWKNGKLLCEVTDQPTLLTAESAADSFLFSTVWNGGAPQTQFAYLDDVVITAQRPRGLDAAGNPMMGAHVPTGPPCGDEPQTGAAR